MSVVSNSRIWETPSENSTPISDSRPAQLPSIATLTNNLPIQSNATPHSPNYPSSNRDSDPWPSQPQSTRSSAYSSGPNGYYYSSSISSPHRASNSSQLGATSHPVEYSGTSGNHQPSSGFSSPHQSLGLPNINQQYHDGSNSNPTYRGSGSHEFPPQESRRSSLGSQVNTGFTNLHINGAVSPYAGSTNASQSSIAVSLQRERGINATTNGIRNSRASSNLGPMSPLSPLPGESRQQYSTRTAPIISANPMKEVYNAEKPTAGQPYAFPDPDMSRSSGSGDDPRPGGTMMSRRNSEHASISSSIFTSDSRMPAGQHRLDEADIPGTHHHSLQHKQVGHLAEESESPDAASPYSRTPALRASHKLAERKRRTEMKYLFDSLRAQIPASHGSKSSKWEILSKASEYIKSLENSNKVGRQAQSQLAQVGLEMDTIKRENDSLRSENSRLYQEMQHYREGSRQPVIPPPQYAAPHAPMLADPCRSLPPLMNGAPTISNPINNPINTSMQGVQYSDERR